MTARVVGTDLEITGSSAADAIVLRLKADNPDSLEVVVGPTRAATFRFRRSTFNRILFAGGAGDDAARIDETAGVFTDTELTTLDGADGRDRLVGGTGAEVLIGDGGEDTVEGNGGADVVLLGTGDDAISWSAGDGNDVIEGQGGADRLSVAGSASSEHINVSAVGSRVRLFRDADQATLDLAGVTAIDFQAGAGADTVTVDDLTGTGLADLTVDLAGDGQPDRITLNGRSAVDDVTAVPDAGGVDVTGLAAHIRVASPDGPEDRLTINGGAANDVVRTTTATAGLMFLSFDGGAGNDSTFTDGSPAADALSVSAPAGRVRVDAGTSFWESTAETTHVLGLGGDDTITVANGLDPVTQVTAQGGDGDDVISGADGIEALFGGPGRDFVRGGPREDLVHLGGDDDWFEWLAGDGSDFLFGESGTDTVTMIGSAAIEDVGVNSSGDSTTVEHLLHSTGVKSLLNMYEIESLGYHALGGSDFIGLSPLFSAELTSVSLHLSGSLGGSTGDVANDIVFLQGSSSSDTVTVSGSSANVHVGGLGAAIDITRTDFPNDELHITTLAGNDTVDQSQLAPNTIRVTVV